MARFIITGEYKDKATKAARKDLKGLSKETDMWAKLSKKAYAAVSVAAGYYAKKILKESITNALDDERSQRLLALTLRNVASATDAAVISAEAQISKMQLMYGITDDQLRPALARLARSTGDTSKAMYDLQLALDISAATGKSLEAVTAALGKAEDGNVASLQRLGLGLDANLIKSKDTKKIFEQLRKTFSGFARQEAKTTEASFRRISVAADEAKEIIGVSLVNAISTLVTNSGGVEGVAKTFETMAQDTADLIDGLAKLGAQVKLTGKGTKQSWVTLIPVIGAYLDQVRKTQAETRKLATIATVASKQIISARNAEYLALKKNKEQEDENTDSKKKTIEQLIAEEYARKAGFKITEDIDSIQTVAAAKRLAEAKEYKMSLIDAAQAGYETIKANADRLTAVWETQKAAFNVFKALLESGLSIPIAMRIAGIGGSTGQSGNAGVGTANTMPTAGLPDPYWVSELPQYNGVYGGNQSSTQINVSVSAGAVGSEEYLAKVINDAILQNTRNGYSQFPAGYTT